MIRGQHFGRSLQLGALRLPAIFGRPDTTPGRQTGGFGGLRAPRGTDAFNVEFVLRAATCIDWTALEPWMAAVDTKIGTPLPSALYKLHALGVWFRLDASTLARACVTRAEFRRFIGAPLHGPLVDVELYLKHATDFARARQPLTKLNAAIELQLVDQGLFPPTEVLGSIALDDVQGPTAPTQILSATQRRNVAQSVGDADAGMPAGRTGTSEHRCNGVPVLVWPWGGMTTLIRQIRIGRDGAFSEFAEHLAADRKVSRQHALLTPLETGVRVQDLGASNGTYIDDEPIPHGSSRIVPFDACLRFGTDLAVMLAFVPDSRKPTLR